MDTEKKTGEKKKSRFGGFFGWSEKKESKESREEFYARMNRESEQREAESRRKRLEEQLRKEEEKKKNDERRKMEEEERIKAEEIEEAKRRKEEEERVRKANEDLESQLRKQREEFSRQSDDDRKRMEVEMQKADDKKEYYDNQRRMGDEKKERERRELEMEIETRNHADLLKRMQQLQNNKQTATTTLTSAVATAARDAAALNEQIIEKFAAENKSQRQLNHRAEEIQKALENAAIEEKTATSMFVKGVDDSLYATALEMERRNEEKLEESRRREKEREEGRVRYTVEWKMKTEMEEDESREKHRIYQESSDLMRIEKEMASVRHEEEMERMRGEHSIRVEEILDEKRRRMEEINRIKKEKDEERRMHWNRMRDAFIEIMRARYGGIMNNEMEMQWDDRFTQLRRSQDPLKEGFSDLEYTPLRKSDVASSLIQFEAHLDSLRMSLTTLEDIMSNEQKQVDTWKKQQPDAHFLFDVGCVLETILSSIVRVRREIDMVVDGIAMNRENLQQLEGIFELRYLEEAMKELTNAVDSIPSVYELNKKYAHVAPRTETTF